jgi:DNA recombination-dependent growth factor C
MMGILSTSVSLTRYRIEGQIDSSQSITERVEACLKKNAFPEIVDEASEIVIGWTSFETPFAPDFQGASFVIGPYFVFSLRIDRKKLPSKIVKKHCAIETARRLKESDREFLSSHEKKQIKEDIINSLILKIPSTPDIFNILWDYENHTLLFFTTQKSANEELETLFLKSFDTTLIRLFPYTMANLASNLSSQQQDRLTRLTPSIFTE